MADIVSVEYRGIIDTMLNAAFTIQANPVHG
jgi:hypothetical protein